MSILVGAREELKEIIEIPEFSDDSKSFISFLNDCRWKVGFLDKCVHDGMDMPDLLLNLWQDPAVACAWKNESKIPSLEGAVSYYIDLIPTMRVDGWIPATEDILNARSRTVGIVELEFQVDGTNYLALDVGGQRNERKKWISHFDEVQAIIFLVSLADYDKVLLEDGVTNRLHEAVKVFKEIRHSPFFESISFILFLNKVDLFDMKIQKTDLNVCFPEYTGGCNRDTALQFVMDYFRDVSMNGPSTGQNDDDYDDDDGSEKFYCYETCATDRTLMSKTLTTCQEIIIRNTLSASGV
jgi:hypothetical protein